jgi:hypothetical protein
VLALLICSAVPPVFFALSSLVSAQSGGGGFTSAAVLSLLLYPFAFALAYAIGWPTFLLLQKLELVRWWSATLAGFVIGCAMFFCSAPNQILQFAALLQWGGMGALTAFIFWLLYARRPDKDVAGNGAD